MTYDPIAVAARAALLDALKALGEHREALVLVGAQAIYLYTGDTDVPIATATKDSDLVVIPSELGEDPALEDAMRAGGFLPKFDADQQQQHGAWITRDGIPIDLIAPAALATGGRGARLPGHDRRAIRKTAGLEAATVDHQTIEVPALDPADHRSAHVRVAGPAALLVAKAHKIRDRLQERDAGRRDRLVDKDAHDIYRLLGAVPLADVVAGFEVIAKSDQAAPVAAEALNSLRDHASDPEAQVCVMAGRAEEGVGDPEDVAVRTWGLVADVLEATAR